MGKGLAERAQAAPAQNSDTKKPLTLPQKIDRMQREFAMAQPQGMEAVQLIRDAQTVLRQTPKLSECDHTTVLGALMTCAQLGLRPGVLGQAYLLPLWNGRNRRMEAQLILGYQGLLELVHRSDRITMIAARRVYENDEFRLDYGLEEDVLIHRPPVEGPRGRVVKWYAIARFKGGGYAITDPITREEMERHRDQYAMAKKKDGTIVGPWVTQFDEMADKTALRQLVKTLPKSPELVRAITHDGAVRQDYSTQGIDTNPTHIEGEVVPESPQVDAAEPEDVPAEDVTVDPEPTEEEAIAQNVLAAFAAKGITDEGNIVSWLQNSIDPSITSVNELSADEAEQVLSALAEG